MALEHYTCSAIAKLFARISVRLPAKIQAVKTSGQAKGYAAHTRREEPIVRKGPAGGEPASHRHPR